MATKITAPFVAYGRGIPTQSIFPVPYIAKRAPTATDQGEIGQLWINTAANTVHVLTSVSAHTYTWTVVS